MATEISVIVSTRDNVEGIKQSLDSLMQQTLAHDRYEIIIADDSTGHDTEELINTPHKTDISVFYVRSEGLGYQHGRNKCLKGASGDLLLFLSDVCLAPATLLEAHIAAHKQHPHRIVRGPLMPLKSSMIVELPEFTAPQLDFTIINASIHKVGIAQIEKFSEECPGKYQDVEMYWRLRQSKFYESFLTSCYCFQDKKNCQPCNLLNIQSRASQFAYSALEYYNSNPQPAALENLNLDFPVNLIRSMLTNSMGLSVATSLLKDSSEGQGWLQSTLMDAVFAYIFYNVIKSKTHNLS